MLVNKNNNLNLAVTSYVWL